MEGQLKPRRCVPLRTPSGTRRCASSRHDHSYYFIASSSMITCAIMPRREGAGWMTVPHPHVRFGSPRWSTRQVKRGKKKARPTCLSGLSIARA